jgi:hypothetical protein
MNVTDIKEVELNAAHIYPNPTNGMLNINVRFAEAQDINIRVFNAVGQVVSHVTENGSMGGNYSVDLSGKTNGIYFVEIMTNNGKVTKKIVLNQ